MSSIIACMLPAPPARIPFTGRGVLSSEFRPMDCASRLAGSTVRTTTWRPRSAALSPIAAAIVVLPTPPEPQQTMILVRRSSMSRSTTSGAALTGRPPRPAARSRCTLVAKGLGELVEGGQVDPVLDQRQRIAGLLGLVETAALRPLRAGSVRLVGEFVG